MHTNYYKIVCISWTNKGLNAINMRGATMKITGHKVLEFCI